MEVSIKCSPLIRPTIKLKGFLFFGRGNFELIFLKIPTLEGNQS